MLDIVLQILPVLGIILLVLLCVIIVFLLLVLFFPVNYKIFGKKDTEDFTLSAKVNWLSGLFRIRYAYPEPGRLTVKILWFMLYDSGTVDRKEKATDKEKDKAKKKTKDKGKDKDNSNDKAEDKAEDKTKDITKDKAKDKTKAISQKQSEDRPDIVSQAAADNMEDAENIENIENIASTHDTNNADSTDNADNEDYTDNINNTDNTKASRSSDASRKEQSQESSENQAGEDGQGSNRVSEKIEKIKFTICSTYDKIKKIWENITYYVFLLQEEETHLLFSHVMKRVRRILGNIRPRKLRVNILFGTGAPDTTGYAFGVYGMFSPVLGPGVIVTPDFERAVLEGDFYATGTITSVVLVWHFLKVIIDKKFWRFIDKLKTGREPVDTLAREPADTFDTEIREEYIKNVL